MPSLPAELWLLISAYLADHDLLAATQVNHTFHSLLNPLLYRNFAICGSQGGFAGPQWRGSTTSSKPRAPISYAERSFATIERLKRIQSSPILMGAIKSCTLCHFDHQRPVADALKPVLQEAVAFISKLPHCRDIVIDSVHIDNRQLKQLIPHHDHNRPMNLTVRSLVLLDDDPTHTPGSQHQCSLKKFTISGLVGSQQSVREFTEWSMSGVLQSFSPGYCLSLFYTQLVQRDFPNLRQLELSHDLRTTQILACLPMLEELTLPSSPPLVFTPTILPRLRTFHGSGNHARSITPGRPIRALHILFDFKGLLPSSVGDEQLNFGSTTSILELSIRGGTPADVIKHGRVTRLCPSLQVLCLTSVSTVKIDAVSVSGIYEEISSPRMQNTFTTEYMHEFYRLKHLRHLDFKFLCHAPSNRALTWERSMCEAFRTRSTPHIHHVSFSMIVEWDRVPYDTTWIPSGVGVSANQGLKLGETGGSYPFMAETHWPDAPFFMDEQ